MLASHPGEESVRTRAWQVTWCRGEGSNTPYRTGIYITFQHAVLHRSWQGSTLGSILYFLGNSKARHFSDGTLP